MTKRTLLISIPIVALVLNGVGYLIVSKVRSPARVAVPTPGNAPQPAGAGPSGHDRPEPGSDEDYRAKEERALARRAAGLAALEAGDYQKALINFTEARVLLGDKARVDELLRVTEDLRSRPASPPRVRAAAGSGAGAPLRAGTRGSPRRVAVKEDAVAESAPAPPPVGPSGLLIVTTTPRGLLVQVDDAAVDLTPMRTKVKPGSHRIALLDGDRKLYETTMDVRDGATATLLKDLSAERTSESSRSSAVAAAAAPARDEPARTSTAPPATSPPPAQPAADAPVQASRPSAPRRVVPPLPIASPDVESGSGLGTGALAISSPGLYGVVWINGRPRGYPPLEVRDLPAGPTKIEVRVNGVQKRSSTVLIKPGLTTAVKIRSQETAP